MRSDGTACFTLTGYGCESHGVRDVPHGRHVHHHHIIARPREAILTPTRRTQKQTPRQILTPTQHPNANRSRILKPIRRGRGAPTSALSTPTPAVAVARSQPVQSLNSNRDRLLEVRHVVRARTAAAAAAPLSVGRTP